MTLTRYAYPATVAEAVALLGEDGSMAIAGGTAASNLPRLKSASLLVDVTRCGLDFIRPESDRLVIGAGVRVADLTVDKLGSSAEAAYLAQCASGISSTQIRNAITLGGNLAYGAAWSDLTIALLALDATVEIAGADGNKQVAIKDFCADAKKAIGKGLITSVSVALKPGIRAQYARFKITDTEIALMAMGVVLSIKDGVIADANVTIGGLCPRPVIAQKVIAALKGKPATEAVFAEAAALAPEDVTIAPNFRMDIPTRARILAVTLRRALVAAGEAQ